MKNIAFIITFTFFIISCIEENRIHTRDKVMVEDKIPGFGTDIEHPDTCIAYYNKESNRIYIKHISKEVIYQYTPWHSTNEWLKYPRSKNRYEISMTFFSRYDTIPIQYTYKDNPHIFNGYKIIYVYRGYYTDNRQTIGAVFDINMYRDPDIDKYRWHL